MVCLSVTLIVPRHGSLPQLQVNYYDTAASLCPIAASTSGQKARLAAKILKAKVDGHVRQNGGAPPKATWQGWAAKAVAAAEAGQSSI